MKILKTSPEQRAYGHDWRARFPWEEMWRVVRRRVQRTGHEFSISPEDVRAAWPADGCCPALGIPMPLPGSRRSGKCGPRPDSPTVDRVDNARGYVPGNIAIISWHANRIKSSACADEITRVAKWLAAKELLQTLL